MVDMDKHACRSLADESYKKKLWPESYITSEFLLNIGSIRIYILMTGRLEVVSNETN